MSTGVSHHISPRGDIEPCPIIQFATETIRDPRGLYQTMRDSAFLRDFRELSAKATRGCVVMERPDLVKRFLQSKKTGFYLAVQREGEVTAGDPIEFTERSESGLTIVDVTNLYAQDSQSQELLRRATEVAALPESWRDYFRKRLWNADA